MEILQREPRDLAWDEAPAQPPLPPLSRAWRLTATAVRAGIDLMLPPRCLGCAQILDTPRSLCGTCWGQVRFITDPACVCCGQPFQLPPPDADARCLACLAKPPPWQRGRAVVLYDDGSRRLVWQLKHGDRTDLAPALGAWMARSAGDLLVDADLVVPVPLHRWRLFRRRYNQSALLAAAMVATLPRDSRPRLIPDALLRRRTGTQAGKRWAQRRRAVQGAFQIRRGVSVRGLAVLVVDDVHTSGATLAACTRVLLAAGAKRVDVMCFARVPRPGS